MPWCLPNPLALQVVVSTKLGSATLRRPVKTRKQQPPIRPQADCGADDVVDVNDRG